MDPLESIKQSTLPVVWKHLSYPALIAFGQTAKEYNEILENPETWVHLLKRDFNINAKPTKAKDYYELLYLVIPNFKCVDEVNNKFQQCSECDRIEGVEVLKKYDGECFKCWYENNKSEFSAIDNDVIILNKLKRIARSRPEEIQTCSISKKEGGEFKHIAIIEGYNIYDIIIKLLVGHELQQVSKQCDYPVKLTEYIRNMIIDRNADIDLGFAITSFSKVLDTLYYDWVDDPQSYTIKRIDNT